MLNFATNIKRAEAKQRSKIWRLSLRFKVFSHHFALPLKYYAELLKGLNPLSTNLTKWPNTQTIRRQEPTNYLSVFDHFVGLALKGLRNCLAM